MWLSKLLTTVSRCFIQFSKCRCLVNELCARSVGFIPCEGNLIPVYLHSRPRCMVGLMNSITGYCSEKGSDSIEQANSTELF